MPQTSPRTLHPFVTGLAPALDVADPFDDYFVAAGIEAADRLISKSSNEPSYVTPNTNTPRSRY
jgi:hypothetical protein